MSENTGALGKFSDFPKHLVKEYFELNLESEAGDTSTSVNTIDLQPDSDFSTSSVEFDSNTGFLDWSTTYDKNESKIRGSYLDGPGTTIYTKDTTWIDVYVKVEGYGFKHVRIKPSGTEWDQDNFLNVIVKDVPTMIGTDNVSYEADNLVANMLLNVADFYMKPEYENRFVNRLELYSSGTFKSYQQVPLYDIDLTELNAVEIYVRSDSFFYTWLSRYFPEKEGFVNSKRTFAYLGQAYIAPNSTDENILWNIHHQGIKDFARNIIPINDMNANLKDFIETFFDKIYHESYNKQKNIATLLDAKEIDIDYLGYLAKQYGVDLDNITGTISETQLRFFVSDLINLLKRKGTYSSLYIIWRTLTGKPQSSLKIYDRWHSKLVTSTPANSGELGWKDFLYTKMYDGSHQYPLTSDDSWGNIAKVSSFTMPVSGCTIEHGLHTKNVLVNCWAEDNTEFYPASILYPTDDTVTIDFGGFFTGVVTVKVPEPQSVLGTSTVLEHNLGTESIFIECYDKNYNKVVPKTVTVLDENKTFVEFHSEFNGFISPSFARNEYLIDSETSEYTVQHNIGIESVMIEVFDVNNNVFYPSLIEVVDGNNIRVQNINDSQISGKVIIEPAEVRLSFTEPSSAWEVNHDMKYTTLIAHCFNTDKEKIYPKSVQLLTTKQARIEFASPVSGYVLLRGIGRKVDETDLGTAMPIAGLTPSTHYKIEIDHTLRPVSNTAIMDENTLNGLIYGWELVRPINRVAHYQQLVSPYLDFTGNKFSLYSTSVSATWYSQYLCTELVTEGAAMKSTRALTYSMNILHNLGRKEVLVQCFNKLFQRVYPKLVNLYDNNNCSVAFNTPFEGHVFVCLPDNLKVQYTGTTWNVIHDLESEFNIFQVYDINSNEYYPSSVVADSRNNVDVVNHASVTGVATVRKPDYVHTQTVASDTWRIEHNQGYIGVMVEAYDSEFNKIEPKSTALLSSNVCELTFGVPVTGSAAIKLIGAPAIEDQTLEYLTSGKCFFKIGDSDSATWDARKQNDIESEIYRGFILPENVTVEPSTTGNYYVTIKIPKKAELNIREIGIFGFNNEPVGHDVDRIENPLILFYTKGALLFKESETELYVKYVINKKGLTGTEIVAVNSDYYDSNEYDYQRDDVYITQAEVYTETDEEAVIGPEPVTPRKGIKMANLRCLPDTLSCTASVSGDLLTIVGNVNVNERPMSMYSFTNVDSGASETVETSGSAYPMLFGMNIGGIQDYYDPEYQEYLAGTDMSVLGFYSAWDQTWAGHNTTMTEAVSAIKEINPDVQLGQYTILNEAYVQGYGDNDVANKLDAESWWLRGANPSPIPNQLLLGSGAAFNVSWVENVDEQGLSHSLWTDNPLGTTAYGGSFDVTGLAPSMWGLNFEQTVQISSPAMANRNFTFSIYLRDPVESVAFYGNVLLIMTDGADNEVARTTIVNAYDRSRTDITTAWNRYSVTGTFGPNPADNVKVKIVLEYVS